MIDATFKHRAEAPGNPNTFDMVIQAKTAEHPLRHRRRAWSASTSTSAEISNHRNERRRR